MTTAIELGLRLLGIFYVLAGIVGMRSAVMDHVLDQMLAGITLKPIPRKDTIRRWIMMVSVLSIAMGGAAIMALSLWAVPLFLVGAVTQSGYLFWARTAFPPESEDESKGRRQTSNASFIYSGATILVCLAAWFGYLRPWLDPWALFIPTTGLALAATVGRQLFWKARRVASADDYPEPEPRKIPPPPARVRLAPNWGGYPLRDADTDDGVIYGDYLDTDLADRLYAWTLAFNGGEDFEAKEFWAQFDNPEAEAAHRAEGDALVKELAAVFGEAVGPVYPPDIRYGPLPEY